MAGMEAPPVFISYSSKDAAAAEAACAALEAHGLACWIAPRNILPGQAWSEAIIEGINGSRVLVLVLSSRSNASAQVMREVSAAGDRQIAIVPLRIEDVRPSGALEYYLSSQHWLDAFTPPLARHLERLVVAVDRLVRGGGNGAPVAPEPQPEPPEVEPLEEVLPDDWSRPAHGKRGFLRRMFDDR
jgi:hypothetical protein